MDVTFTLGHLVLPLTIVGLVGPGMYKLGTLAKSVDHHDGQISKLFDKLDALLEELRRAKI